MYIFNRYTDRRHPLFAALKKRSKCNDDYRAIACNFMYEPRVSHAREKFFIAMAGACSNPRTLMEVLGRYVRQHVQQTLTPDFENSYNDDNQVESDDKSLVSILVINGFSRMFLWARNFPQVKISRLPPKLRRAFQRFATYPNHADPNRQDSLDFLNEAMRNRTMRAEFLDLVCALYEIYRVKYPYHPMWLTKWSDFCACNNINNSKQANQWCNWVGVSTEKKVGQWIAVLRYPAQQLRKRIYHPTVLDAGANAYHFPAPEGVTGGGRAADLSNRSTKLACEYIVKWPALNLAKIDFVRGCRQLKADTDKPVREIRRHHIRRLRDEFRHLPSASKWLKRLGNF